MRLHPLKEENGTHISETGASTLRKVTVPVDAAVRLQFVTAQVADALMVASLVLAPSVTPLARLVADI